MNLLLPRLRSLRIAPLIAAAALSASAQEVHFEAEAFGVPSGPGVIRALGPILELVPDPAGPGSLRLFGGVPGEPAAVRIGRTVSADPGPDGTTSLVGQGALVIRGTFDATGSFRVELADLPREMFDAGAYAQGIQGGELAWGPIRRVGYAMSQGLHLAPAELEAPQTYSLASIGSRLPEERRSELDASFAGGNLGEFLATALDSDGDEVGVKIDADAAVTVAPGVSFGAKGAFEVVVARSDASSYSVSVKREAALLANVGLGDFAGVEGAKGLSGRVIFTFPSAAGAARGIWGLWLAQHIPLGTTLPEMPDRRPLDVAEAAWGNAHAHLVAATSRVAAARANVARAGSGQSGPIAFVARSAAVHLLAVVEALLNGARLVETRALVGMQSARAFFEEALSGFWKIQRLLFELESARRYTLLHADGHELAFNSTTEFKLSLLGSVVTVQGTDLGFKAGMERAVSVRIGEIQRGAPVPIEVTLRRKGALEGWAGMGIGGRAAFERSLVGRMGFEIGPGASSESTQRVALEADAWARYEEAIQPLGFLPVQGVVSTSGVGRRVSFDVPLEDVIAAAGAFDGQGGGLEALATLSGDLDLCDYRIEGYVVRFGINIAGTGGSIGFQALVKDGGDVLEIDGINGRRALRTVTQAAENWIAP